MRAGADIVSSNLPQILTTGFLALDWTSPSLAHSEAASPSEDTVESNRKRPLSAVVEEEENIGKDSLLSSNSTFSSSNPATTTTTTTTVESEFTKKLTKNAMRTIPNEDEKGGNESKDSYQKTVLTSRLKMKRSMYSSYCLDMTDERFARDTQPLVAGCECHACRYLLYSYFPVFHV
jgi:hypothetical protein